MINYKNISEDKNKISYSVSIGRTSKLVLVILTDIGCGHTTELNRDLASKSRLTSNHDLVNNRDLIYF